MKSLAFAVVLLFCVACSHARPKNAPMWLPCETTKGTGKTIDVIVNKRKDECILTRGTTANFTLVFSPTIGSKSVKAVVHGEVFGQEVPFPLKDPDVCNNHGVKCPIVPGKQYTYNTGIDVLKIYPSMSVTIKWENVEDDSKDVICVELNCRLV